MKTPSVFLYSVGLIAGTCFVSSTNAACASNEINDPIQIQIGESWNQLLAPGESKCAEGQGGLVSVWAAPTPEPEMNLESLDPMPDATGQVAPDGSVRIVAGYGDNYLVIYGPDGQEQSREEIAAPEEEE